MTSTTTEAVIIIQIYIHTISSMIKLEKIIYIFGDNIAMRKSCRASGHSHCEHNVMVKVYDSGILYKARTLYDISFVLLANIDNDIYRYIFFLY